MVECVQCRAGLPCNVEHRIARRSALLARRLRRQGRSPEVAARTGRARLVPLTASTSVRAVPPSSGPVSSVPSPVPVALRPVAPVPSRQVSSSGGDDSGEPDPAVAALLAAPRRTLRFPVAPFGAPPFGPPVGPGHAVRRASPVPGA